MDAILNFLGYGFILVIIFGIILFFIVWKMMDDIPIDDDADLSDIDYLAAEGWNLIYKAEDNDYYMLAQVFQSDKCNTYRTILTNTAGQNSIEDDSEYDSLDDAKEAADAWVEYYVSEENQGFEHIDNLAVINNEYS